RALPALRQVEPDLHQEDWRGRHPAPLSHAMCGICARVGPGPADPGMLAAMTRALAHRGPDGDGLRVAGDVGLGHRRLSVIDPEGGAQPMASEDGALWITFNGEI